MSNILLYHHLGLGDHFMCHGIVREYCKQNEKVSLVCLPQYYSSISFMFRDLQNLTVLKGDDAFVQDLIQKNSSLPAGEKYDEIKVIGFQYLNKDSNVPLEVQFYQLAGVPFNKKWESFHIDRDRAREEAVFQKTGLDGDYAFIHEDVSRNFAINKDLIDKNCKWISADKSLTDNAIDYCTLIEKAKEIHVIDSSFMFLVEFLDYSNPNQKLFIHRYARENHEWLLPVLKKDWHIIIDRHEEINPAKEALRVILGNKNTILRKIVRRIFKKLKWDMVRPCQPDLQALIKRYAFEKSFLVISSLGIEDTYASVAHNAGATTTSVTTLEKATPTDVILHSGDSSKDNNYSDILQKLHSITKDRIIFHLKNTDPKYIETLLSQAGFETREKHLFPFEVCFVCKAIPKN